MWHKDVLGDFGKVSILYQSEYTRGENSKQDRFTLFRIQRTEFSKSNPSGNGPQPLGQAMDAGTPAEQTGKGTS
jgi:hypothetical protein